MISPQSAVPFPVNNPCLAPIKVMVKSAFTALSSTEPVFALSPEGISIDKTGNPA
ncbi:MAG: Uncharacterised protein [Cellvibrionales bacterium UBA7375]|nr:MAG: Uncharacterised protein [Cellvibrionales bacterium UBA7375]